MSVPLRPAGRPRRRSPRNAWLILVAFAIPAALAVMGWSAAPVQPGAARPGSRRPARATPRSASTSKRSRGGRPRPAPPSTPAPASRATSTSAPASPSSSVSRAAACTSTSSSSCTTCPPRSPTSPPTSRPARTAAPSYHQLVPDYRRRCASADCNEWVSIDIPLAQLPSSGWAMFKLLPHADTPDGNAQRVVSGWWAYIDNGKPAHQVGHARRSQGIGWFSPGGPAGKYSGRRDRQQRPALEPADRPGRSRSAAPGNRPSRISRDEALVLIDPALHANPPNFGNDRPLQQRPLGPHRKNSPSTPPSSPTANTASSSAAATPAPTARTAASSSSRSS